MTKHLGLCQGSFSVRDSDAMAEALVLDHNLSIMAVDRATGAPLAVALNGVMMAGEADMSREEVLSSCIDPKFGPIAGILHQVQQDSRAVWADHKTDKMFDIKMLAVAPEARGRGLGTDLIRRSVQLASCLGFKACKTEATGDFSRKGMERAGFKTVRPRHPL